MLILLFTLLSAIWHGLGHLLTALALKIPVKGIRYHGTGPRLLLGKIPSYHAEALIAAAGPLFNFALCFFLDRVPLPFHEMFFAISLFQGIWNLFPFRDTDGSRILYVLLAGKSPALAERMCHLLHTVTLTFFWVFAVYLLLRTGSSILLFFFTGILFSESVRDANPEIPTMSLRENERF